MNNNTVLWFITYHTKSVYCVLFCCLLVCYMLQTYKNTGLSYKLPRPIAINPNFAN